ncbi:MAG: antibiotic biosynthesis monooxygenase [Xanthomonadales bacterium]|nr:antibiotic biosynthesis monooxygenase [Xanthomonadales bacterium]
MGHLSLNQRFAGTPAPPYFAVIFSSTRRENGAKGYAHAAERMVELASQQPGFLGVESSRDAEGFGITVSYWESEAAIAAWKHQTEHRATREQGRRDWYAQFEVRVCKVERAYGFVTREAA